MEHINTGAWLRRLALAAGLLLGAAPMAQAAHLKQFMPQGRVDQQTRATAQFDTDMVRLGDTSAAAPLLADCGAVTGQGRWIDARSWAWQLDRPLQPGERCSFKPDPAFRDLAGAPLSAGGRLEFFASGPWPRSVFPRPGSPIDEEQAFIINAGGPLKAASVQQQMWCEADGVGQRIGVRLLSDADRNAVLEQIRRTSGMDFGPEPLVLQCAERLPAGAKMRLVWGKGIEAANGAARSDKEESFPYTVRPPFHATLSCERENARAPCSPLSSVRVEFDGVPIELATLLKIHIVTPDGTRTPKDPNQDSSARQTSFDAISFAGPWPQDAELRLELPGGLKDEAGRPLVNADRFPLKFRTGRLPPLAKFPGSFGIVELKEGALLPVTLRNVEAALASRQLKLPGSHALVDQRLTDDASVIATMRELARFEQQTRKVPLKRDNETLQVTDPFYARELSFLAKRAGVTRMEIPKPGGSAEFEVVGIPLAKPGYHVVEIESRLLGNALLSSPKPMYVRAAALVTNMAVHFKRGRDNALVWVTTLDNAQPVGNAEVRVSDCNGKSLWLGRTDTQGRALIDQALAVPNCVGNDSSDSSSFLFASARLGDDYSFVRSDWNEGLESWRFGVQTWGESDRFKIHSVLDRTLLRPGQTVSMKHIARSRSTRGFALPEPAELPTKLTIRHWESGAEFSQPLQWSANGSAVSSWKIPDSAKRGDYSISLSGGRSRDSAYAGELGGGQFRVGDFRLPVFTGSVQGVPARQVAPSKVPLALGLSFLNGGAAKGAEVKVSATLRPRWPTYAHYEAFNFTIDFNDETLTAFGITPDREQEHLVLDAQALKLDQAGAAKLDVPLPQAPRGPSELYAEMSFTDPNGEVQTLHGTVELSAAQLALGIKMGDWASSRGQSQRVTLVVLDTNGQPVTGQEVTVQAKRQIDYSHRRRIVGGFYAYEHQTEYTDLGQVCKGQTDSRGLLLCEVTSDQPGNIHLLAQTRDAQGRTARASSSVWISGAGDLWFVAGNQDRIDVIPEKRSYQPGETAKLQVRSPFLEATALISVEAGGIIETFVQPLSRFKPVIELPVKAEWGPNVYVSVLAVRGRVEPLHWTSFFSWGWREPAAWFKAWWNPLQPTAMVDLAKPAYRLGLAELNVGVQGFELKVEVQPEKADYRPRDQAKVRIKVTKPDGQPAAGAEVAFAGVDQALLELRPNDSWNLLQALLPKRAYEVETATAQGQVIGKRHFGKKAVPTGGGGGRGPARELFDTLLLWQPRVLLDAQGQATLTVPINDSLTEFKLVGVATAGAGLFGTGSASVRTKQDLQLIAGLPPLVREKDRYQALLTLRNGTSRAMTVQVQAKAGDKAFAPQQIKLEPEGATELSWPAEVPEGVASQVWEFEAIEQGGSSARDRLKITQQVVPAVPVTVHQATFTRIDGRFEVPATPPAGALPGKGGIELSLSPKLSTPPSGLRRYLEAYPFSCLEQRTSVAVGLNDPKRWEALAADLPALIDTNGLARYFPGDGPGSVTLTAYVLDMAALSGFALPDDARAKLLQGLSSFVEGRFKSESWSPGGGGQLELRLMALEALTRHGAKPVRAVAALDVEPLRLPTSALLDWWLVLRRLPDVPQQAALAKAAEQEVRNRLTYTGGRLGFTSERSDYWWWMMVSGDSNAFRLVEAALDLPGWKDDLPRLLQGAMERQVRGHWFTTTANAWAAVTLAQFGQRFEREPVGGITRASLGAARAELRWKAADLDTPPAPLSLPWPGSTGAASGGAGTLSVVHDGSGKPWATVQVLAAIPGGAPRAFGYRVTRSVAPIQSKTPGQTSRGDLWRVTLDVEAEQDMAWVVVTDPIPAGARILGDGDGRDSHIATLDEDQRHRRVWPTFVERTFSSFNAYYEVVPRGHFSIEYTVRLNNAGTFALPPTRVEAMYAPDVFGEAPNEAVVVKP
ncbi:MAG: alpha-2-macroglobulin [Leptothrix sp. (in: b-proteobacteria)]